MSSTAACDCGCRMPTRVQIDFGSSGYESQIPRAAYIHVPFCHQRCPYCNFTLVANRPEWIDRYLSALERELVGLKVPRTVDTIFIGGGTPTLLNESQLLRMMDSLCRWLPIADSGEWTIEANPSDLDEQKCRMLVKHGVTRISIGGQSFNLRKLQVLGRDHDGHSLRTAIEIASRFFTRVSLDLIFGAPEESLEVWNEDLDQAIASGVQHVSTYGLTYEKGAAFWSQLRQKKIQAAAEDLELAMYWTAIDKLTAAGMIHYEISNFARSNDACRHNETYWSLRPWWGFGPGAAGFADGVRYVNHRSTSKYLQRIEASQSPVAESEQIDWSQWTRERFVFGMRKLAGVDWSELEKTGEPGGLLKIRPIIDRHIDMGWFIEEQSRVRLSKLGLAVSDALWPAYF